MGDQDRFCITGLLLELLQNKRTNQRGDSLVFPSPNCSSRPIDIRSAWESGLKKAGIEGFVFHGLRHQTASYAATIEDNPLVIGELLGHDKTLCSSSKRSYACDGGSTSNKNVSGISGG